MGDWTGYLLLILDGAWVTVRLTVMGCALALEFKKTFMDEWTGVPDEAHLDALREAGTLQHFVPLDVSESALRAAAGSASFGYLKDILMRLPAIDPAALPGDAATAPDRPAPRVGPAGA